MKIYIKPETEIIELPDLMECNCGSGCKHPCTCDHDVHGWGYGLHRCKDCVEPTGPHKEEESWEQY